MKSWSAAWWIITTVNILIIKHSTLHDCIRPERGQGWCGDDLIKLAQSFPNLIYNPFSTFIWFSRLLVSSLKAAETIAPWLSHFQILRSHCESPLSSTLSAQGKSLKRLQGPHRYIRHHVIAVRAEEGGAHSDYFNDNCYNVSFNPLVGKYLLTFNLEMLKVPYHARFTFTGVF